MSNLDKYKSMGATAAAEGADQSVAKKGGGGDYTPPAAGFCLLRLVEYIELGKQKGSFQGKPTIKEKVQLTFEVSGPKHPPREGEDGAKYPHRITIEENLSSNEKARFFKLFNILNYQGQAKHMVELLDTPMKGIIIHRKYKRRDGQEGVAVELWDKAKGVWTIEPPRVDVMDQETGMPTGELRVLTVPPALSTFRAFLWNYSDLADWTGLFIEGEYEEKKNDKGEVTHKAKSKNVIQNKIKSATNFNGSPIYTLIAAAGGNLDIPDVADQGDDEEEGNEGTTETATQGAARQTIDSAPQGQSADDALNGVA